ncbi:hypothetical protein Tco_0513679 [Tanacetum coccineum]
MFEEAESSSTFQDPSNMHEFHQKHRSSDKWTKNHPIEQVIGDPSKPVMTRNLLQTDLEVCMYALTVSTIKSKNIKEAMLDASWIESMQDELNQFKRLDVWELVEYADHVRYNDDCKSTSRGIQFLGDKLVSWSSKKQDCTAMSTTEAEYVSLSACCAQVIWMRT